MADQIRSTLPSMATSTPTSTLAPRPRRLSLFGPPIGVLEVFAKEMAFLYQAPFLALQAAVELGTELDEPTDRRGFGDTHPAAAAPPAAPAHERLKPAIGTGLDWQTARDRLIDIRRRGESFTSLRDLTAPRGTIPNVRIGTCVLYPVTGLQAWLDRQAQGASAAPGRSLHRSRVRGTATAAGKGRVNYKPNTPLARR